MITIQYDDHDLKGRLASLASRIANPRALLVAVGREGANQLKAHFRLKNQTPNKLGGPRQNFWNQVQRSVQAPVTNESEAVISITHPAFAQKVFGGAIRAKRKKYLTIPVTPEAYGKTAATFEAETHLKLVFLKSSRGGVLVTMKPDKTFRVEYVLKEEVRQEADPSALPNMKLVAAAMASRAEKVVDRLQQEAGLS